MRKSPTLSKMSPPQRSNTWAQRPSSLVQQRPGRVENFYESYRLGLQDLRQWLEANFPDDKPHHIEASWTQIAVSDAANIRLGKECELVFFLAQKTS